MKNEFIEDLTKAINLGQLAVEGLQKSHVKEYTRTTSNNKSAGGHDLKSFYGGNDKDLEEDIKYHGSKEKLAFQLGWQHENRKTKGHRSEREPTEKELGNLKGHYQAGKKHALEKIATHGDADSGSHDAFDEHMGKK